MGKRDKDIFTTDFIFYREKAKKWSIFVTLVSLSFDLEVIFNPFQSNWSRDPICRV